MTTTDIVLAIRGITKRFGPLVANDGISLTLRRGEILALLGENGAGKTTLMNVLFGQYVADEGSIEAFGATLPAGSPAAAIDAGIGMVHQHFTLAENLTVLENILIGTERLFALRQRTSAARQRLRRLAETFGLAIDPDRRVADLAVGERQRVEILKALYRDVRILIMDEPTAVLTPQEAESLFETLREMTASGLSIVFISHKLNEALAIADRIAVLRNGQLVAETEPTSTTKARLAHTMVGEVVPEPKRTPMSLGPVALSFRDVSVPATYGTQGLEHVSLTVHQHEIVGIAGVSGNGQRPLADLVSGLVAPEVGAVTRFGVPLTRFDPADTVRAGIGRIPEDRQVTGVIGDMTVSENLVLETYREPAFSRLGWLSGQRLIEHAHSLVKAFDVRGATPHTAVRRLSGGNIQKLILARVLERQPGFILANQPTRGLDIGAATYVHEQLFAARARGAGILLMSEDLEELLALADTVQVLFQGQLSVPMPVEAVSLRQLGLMMSGQDPPGDTGYAA